MSSKHGDEVDGYLQDFAEWAVKEDFSQDVEDWMEKHCDIFEHTRKAKFFGVRTSRYPFDEVVKGIDVEADASYTFEKRGMVITDIARGKAPGSVKKRFGYVSFFSCCVCF